MQDSTSIDDAILCPPNFHHPGISAFEEPMFLLFESCPNRVVSHPGRKYYSIMEIGE